MAEVWNIPKDPSALEKKLDPQQIIKLACRFSESKRKLVLTESDDGNPVSYEVFNGGKERFWFWPEKTTAADTAKDRDHAAEEDKNV